MPIAENWKQRLAIR